MYADAEYYLNTYKGQAASETVLEPLLERASEIIDMLTGDAIDMDELHTIQQEKVKKATCAQAEYLLINGNVYTEDDSVKSVRIGSYSENRGDAQGNTAKAGIPRAIAPMAKAFLENTGLLFRGVR